MDMSQIVNAKGNPVNTLPIGYKYINMSKIVPTISNVYINAFAVDGDKIYAIIRHRTLAVSTDGGETWIEDVGVTNGDYTATVFNLSAISVDKKTGTILVMGNRIISTVSKLCVWRKAVGDTTFTQIVLEDFVTSPTTISIGKSGVYFVCYNTKDLYRSTDDGLTFTKYTFTAGQVVSHVHEVWADPSSDYVYVSSGDDDGGTGAGGVYRSNDFATWVNTYQEEPGVRIVAITGNQRKRFLGVEHINGGVLTTTDDANYEMAMGRRNMGYTNFNCLKFGHGMLVQGFYQYAVYPTDARAGHGGEIWISDDDGASFERIITEFRKVTAIEITSKWIFVAFGYSPSNRGDNPTSPYLLRIPNPKYWNFRLNKENRSTKIVMNQTSQITDARLLAGEATHKVNMTPYTNVGVYINVKQAGALTIKGMICESGGVNVPDVIDDTVDWITLKTVTFASAGEQIVQLDAGAQLFSYFRIENNTASTVSINEITFLGSGVS